MRYSFSTLLVAVLLASSAPAAGPKVDVVVGPQAPRLEKFAAEELAGLLRQLFEAEVRMTEKMSPESPHTLLVGSPATSEAVKAVAGDNWPKLTDQGHVVRSYQHRGKPVLVTGGGSPVATLWAVYELGHRWGIRYLLTGDYLPVVRPDFRLDGFDVILEPVLRDRIWHWSQYSLSDMPNIPVGLAEHKRLLRQLAKLKFNQLTLEVTPFDPFVHYEFRGVKRQSAHAPTGRIALEGDTPGRAAFRGATTYAHPEFGGKTRYEELIETGKRYATGLMDEAHNRGMRVALSLSVLAFPGEFAAALPGARKVSGVGTVVTPGPDLSPESPILQELSATVLRAYLTTYPVVDTLEMKSLAPPGWDRHHERAWKRLDERLGLGKYAELRQLNKVAGTGQDFFNQFLLANLTEVDYLLTLLDRPGLLRRADGSQASLALSLDGLLIPPLAKALPRDTALRWQPLRPGLPPVTGRCVMTVQLSRPAGEHTWLPQSHVQRLHKELSELQRLGWVGYSGALNHPGNLDATFAYLARRGFDASLTPEGAFADLVTPICGEGVAERVAKGLGAAEEATALLAENGFGAGQLRFSQHGPTPGTTPEWLKKARTLYAGAMDEMYRANTRARQGGRNFTLYHAKRMEFAVHYLNALEAFWDARRLQYNDGEKYLAHLEKATEALYSALNAYGEVARDESDRAAIAALNEYAYRRLQKELEAAEKALNKDK